MKLESMVLVLALAAACGREEPPSTATHFHGMRLILGDGSPAIEDAALLVDGGRVVALGRRDDVPAPAGATDVDLSGRTLMPLLTSLHVHAGLLVDDEMAAENYSRESILSDLNRYAHYGVGSVLVLGSDIGDTAFQIREDQREGRVSGARLHTVGRGITCVGGWPTIIPAIAAAPQQVATEEEAREAVRKLAEQNVDAVKIWVDDAGGRIPKISPELYRAVIDEASQHGLKALAHVFYLDDAKGLVEAGISGLAHSIRDAEVDDALIEAMREKGVFYIPTLVAHEATLAYADRAEWVGEPAMRETVDAAVIENLLSDTFVESQRNDPSLPALREQYRLALVNLKKLSDAGITIGLGTDSGTPHRFPGYFEHRELKLMVDAGLTPEQAIVAATQSSAGVLGEDGTLREGGAASFLVLRSNPLDDIRNTRDIEAVYFDGKPFPRTSKSSPSDE